MSKKENPSSFLLLSPQLFSVRTLGDGAGVLQGLQAAQGRLAHSPPAPPPSLVTHTLKKLQAGGGHEMPICTEGKGAKGKRDSGSPSIPQHAMLT